MTRPTAVVFDVGNVLYRWNPRSLYQSLVTDPVALDHLMDEVLTEQWHAQHDAGRPFAETSAELSARFPEHRALIAQWGPRFGETITGAIDGMPALVERLDSAGVPLFAITNFSAEFWAPFRAREAALFDRFRDIVVSGTERLMKPDPAIYDLALKRFGLAVGEGLFVDDRQENIRSAERAGLVGHLFIDAADLERRLAALGLLGATAR